MFGFLCHIIQAFDVLGVFTVLLWNVFPQSDGLQYWFLPHVFEFIPQLHILTIQVIIIALLAFVKSIINFHVLNLLFILLQLFFFGHISSYYMFFKSICAAEHYRLHRLSNEVKIFIQTLLIFVKIEYLFFNQLQHWIDRRFEFRVLCSLGFVYAGR